MQGVNKKGIVASGRAPSVPCPVLHLQRSFEAAQQVPVHPTNPALEPVEILPGGCACVSLWVLWCVSVCVVVWCGVKLCVCACMCMWSWGGEGGRGQQLLWELSSWVPAEQLACQLACSCTTVGGNEWELAAGDTGSCIVGQQSTSILFSGL